MAALLSMQNNPEDIDKYVKVAKDMGIKIKVPNINLSKKDFTAIAEEKAILYGIGSIKGVGETSIHEIINNAPYTSIDDAKERLSTKAFNKKIAEALIKGGAFDCIEQNRFKSLNYLHEIRKDKIEKLDEDFYTEKECILLETESLGASITYDRWWDKMKDNQKISETFILKSVSEREDKKKKLMAFLTLDKDGQEIKGLIFATKYAKLVNNLELNKELLFTGKKSNGNLLIDSVA